MAHGSSLPDAALVERLRQSHRLLVHLEEAERSPKVDECIRILVEARDRALALVRNPRTDPTEP
jgi:hypothetical protein